MVRRCGECYPADGQQRGQTAKSYKPNKCFHDNFPPFGKFFLCRLVRTIIDRKRNYPAFPPLAVVIYAYLSNSL
jgi:hypothetical protein